MRLGEALRLRLADVDLTLGIITLRDTKFYKSRLVPLGPDLAKLIREYLRQAGTTKPTLSTIVSDEER
jgi:integrase